MSIETSEPLVDNNPNPSTQAGDATQSAQPLVSNPVDDRYIIPYNSSSFGHIDQTKGPVTNLERLLYDDLDAESNYDSDDDPESFPTEKPLPIEKGDPDTNPTLETSTQAQQPTPVALNPEIERQVEWAITRLYNAGNTYKRKLVEDYFENVEKGVVDVENRAKKLRKTKDAWFQKVNQEIEALESETNEKNGRLLKAIILQEEEERTLENSKLYDEFQSNVMRILLNSKQSLPNEPFQINNLNGLHVPFHSLREYISERMVRQIVENDKICLFRHLPGPIQQRFATKVNILFHPILGTKVKKNQEVYFESYHARYAFTKSKDKYKLFHIPKLDEYLQITLEIPLPNSSSVPLPTLVTSRCVTSVSVDLWLNLCGLLADIGIFIGTTPAPLRIQKNMPFWCLTAYAIDRQSLLREYPRLCEPLLPPL